ncbi:dihydropteroate synthase [Actinomyces provencensis]|nr:dihydropteroate synthase [Actinomyces provencensis]
MTDASAPRGPLLPHGPEPAAGRTLVMGILNVTPDSFSDGGLWRDPARALDHARSMVADGADLVDVGGESTRPGSARITAEEEWSRIGEVVGALAEEGVLVSVDTVHAGTARRAAEVGAALVNDVSGGRADPGMPAAMAASGCACIIQHWRGFPGSPQEDFTYADVVADVCAEVLAQVDTVVAAGVDPARIAVDPGLGFSLLHDQSWALVDSVESLVGLGYPVVVGASRKRFLALRGGDDPGWDRDRATAEIPRRAARAGVWAVRVHDVAGSARAVREAATGKEQA